MRGWFSVKKTGSNPGVRPTDNTSGTVEDRAAVCLSRDGLVVSQVTM